MKHPTQLIKLIQSNIRNTGTNIYPKNGPNVGKYTIMDICGLYGSRFRFQSSIVDICCSHQIPGALPTAPLLQHLGISIEICCSWAILRVRSVNVSWMQHILIGIQQMQYFCSMILLVVNIYILYSLEHDFLTISVWSRAEVWWVRWWKTSSPNWWHQPHPWMPGLPLWRQVGKGWLEVMDGHGISKLIGFVILEMP